MSTLRSDVEEISDPGVITRAILVIDSRIRSRGAALSMRGLQNLQRERDIYLDRLKEISATAYREFIASRP